MTAWKKTGFREGYQNNDWDGRLGRMRGSRCMNRSKASKMKLSSLNLKRKAEKDCSRGRNSKRGVFYHIQRIFQPLRRSWYPTEKTPIGLKPSFPEKFDQ